MARWAQIWAPKLGPKSGPPNLGPKLFPNWDTVLKRRTGDPFSGPCLGSENGANFANKLGSEFEKRAAKRKLANLPQTANISPSRSLGKRAAEKIKATTFRCGLNPHELFTTLWSNRLQLLSWRHETRLRRYLICFDWSMRQMSRPQPARPPLATRTYLDHCKPVARRRATKKAWLGGPKFGPQNWVPNLDPKFGPQTLPQLGHCLEKKDRGPFFGALPGVRKWSQLCKQVGVWVRKKGSEEKAGKPAAKLPTYLL